MRTAEIFARGSCRALKWVPLFGVLLALGAGQAAAQSPSAPVNLEAEVMSGSVMLTWDTPGRSPVAITGFEARFGEGGAVATAQWVVVDAGTETHTFDSGVDNGTTYRFQVRSVGAGDTSDDRVVSAPRTVSATPIAVPGVPTTPKATAGDKMVTLTWKAPARW